MAFLAFAVIEVALIAATVYAFSSGHHGFAVFFAVMVAVVGVGTEIRDRRSTREEA